MEMDVLEKSKTPRALPESKKTDMCLYPRGIEKINA
jgi:hypothetical protein